MNELISDLTSWIPWSWLESLVVVLVYLGILGALSLAPLIAWLVAVAALGSRGPVGAEEA